LNPDEYQAKALRTAGQDDLTMSALGLAGESSEFLELISLVALSTELTIATGKYTELIKKHKYHGHELDKAKAIKELGDVQWYLAVAAATLDVPLSVVMEENIRKLEVRYPEKFSTEASVNRTENKEVQ
jgi:NTP pyrophosphatase (non-canonical NTP hydrolase)